MKSFSAAGRIGIDLGSSQIRIYAGNKIILSENSAAVINNVTGAVEGFGVGALVLYHREPEKYRLEWPVSHGTIADYDLTKGMLQYFLEKVMHHSVSRPKAGLAVPSGTSTVVRHALTDAALHAGMREVYLISSPAAALLGAGWPLSGPAAALSVVVGRDITNCGLFSCGGVVAEGAIPFGGYDIDNGIRTYMMEKHHMMIGLEMAETIKREMASVTVPKEALSINVRGRRAEDGVELILVLSARELYPIMQLLLLPVTRLIKRIVRSAEPEMAGDLLKNGILLSGGLALLKGMSDWVASEIGIPVFVPENPEETVAAGCFLALSEYEKLPDVIENGEMYCGKE